MEHDNPTNEDNAARGCTLMLGLSIASGGLYIWQGFGAVMCLVGLVIIYLAIKD